MLSIVAAVAVLDDVFGDRRVELGGIPVEVAEDHRPVELAFGGLRGKGRSGREQRDKRKGGTEHREIPPGLSIGLVNVRRQAIFDRPDAVGLGYGAGFGGIPTDNAKITSNRRRKQQASDALPPLDHSD